MLKSDCNEATRDWSFRRVYFAMSDWIELILELFCENSVDTWLYFDCAVVYSPSAFDKAVFATDWSRCAAVTLD